MSKHTKFRSLMSILYALIMLLPLSSVAFRCFYTIFNKNAYESYSGNTEVISNVQTNYKYQTNEVNSIDDLVDGNIYHFTCSQTDYPSLQIMQMQVYAIYNYQACNTAETFLYNYTIDNSTDYLQIWIGYDNYCCGVLNSLNGGLNYFTWANTNNQTIDFDFVYKQNYSSTYLPFVSLSSFNFIESVDITTTDSSTLDNAFEYSLHEFVGQNGRGVLNLTDWFTSVFLQSSTHTQLYLDFINWYMNYTLLVSCVYILYLVLMWFVSLARRLLTNMIEKGGDLK